MYQLSQKESSLCWSEACMGLMQRALQLWLHMGRSHLLGRSEACMRALGAFWVCCSQPSSRG